MRPYAELRAALARSAFRSRFRLSQTECRIAAEAGREKMAGIAAAILRERLAPAIPVNDGRQTPMRGHPVFTAQHACGICCRQCLAKWHGIPLGRELSGKEIAELAQVLTRWIFDEAGDLTRFAVTPEMFPCGGTNSSNP